MNKNTTGPASDLRGISRLTIDAVLGLTDLVEALHHNIAGVPGILGKERQGPTGGITGLVYKSIRRVTRLVGTGIDQLLAQLVPLLGADSAWPGREPLLAALNGVLGDYLVASGNPLAISMRLRRNGLPLRIEKQALAAEITQAGGKLVVLAHGLCMNDLQWNRKEHDHGAALARDLGYTPVYLHYNTGLHISANGREFAELLETLLAQWPARIEELVVIGHSMGGLVARSACHYGALAGHKWLRRLEKLVFIGTPHHGSPLERGGNWVDIILGTSPYLAPFARLGKIRSAGITDLRHGNLLDEDWGNRDRFERTTDPRARVPLPKSAQCYAMAASIGMKTGGLTGKSAGDGLVPLVSALGRHEQPSLELPFPESRQWIGYGMNHLDLLNRPEAYEQIRRWLVSPR